MKFKFITLKSCIAVERVKVLHLSCIELEHTITIQEVPEFEEILPKIGENGKIFPEVMAVYLDLILIVMEDLSDRNFVMANRLIGLDINHVKLSLKNLARLHAASVVLYEKDKNLFVNLDTGYFTRKTEAFHTFYKSCFQVLIVEIEKWTEWEESSYFVEKLKKLQPNLIEYGRKTFDCDETDFNCLNQGDLWTNNVMFQYNTDNEPEKATLIDFQFFFYGSAALDLHYFMYTSVQDSMRLENMDEMIQFYFYETSQDFQLQVLKKLFHGFFCCMIIFPIHICEDKNVDFEVLMSMDARSLELKSKIYSIR